DDARGGVGREEGEVHDLARHPEGRAERAAPEVTGFTRQPIDAAHSCGIEHQRSSCPPSARAFDARRTSARPKAAAACGATIGGTLTSGAAWRTVRPCSGLRDAKLGQ